MDAPIETLRIDLTRDELKEASEARAAGLIACTICRATIATPETMIVARLGKDGPFVGTHRACPKEGKVGDQARLELVAELDAAAERAARGEALSLEDVRARTAAIVNSPPVGYGVFEESGTGKLFIGEWTEEDNRGGHIEGSNFYPTVAAAEVGLAAAEKYRAGANADLAAAGGPSLEEASAQAKQVPGMTGGELRDRLTEAREAGA